VAEPAPVTADQEEALREDEAEFRQPAPPPIPVRKRYYITECEHCAWVGSSEQCGSYDDSMSCPVCCSEMCGDEPDEAEIAKHGEAVMQRIIATEAKVDQLASELREAREERHGMIDDYAALVMRKVEQRLRAEAAEANLIDLAKMYGEACGRLATARYERFRTDRRIRLQRFALREANKYTDKGTGSRAYVHLFQYAQKMSRRAHSAAAEIASLRSATGDGGEAKEPHDYEVIGTTYDGVKVLRAISEPTNFTREEIRAAVEAALQPRSTKIEGAGE